MNGRRLNRLRKAGVDEGLILSVVELRREVTQLNDDVIKLRDQLKLDHEYLCPRNGLNEDFPFEPCSTCDLLAKFEGRT